jgi:hypothetical protein
MSHQDATPPTPHHPPEVTTTTTRYTVSVLPAGHPDRWLWSATVALTAQGWIVHDADTGYDAAGQRVPLDNAFPHPDREQAMSVARRVAPHVTLNGHTVTTAPA